MTRSSLARLRVRSPAAHVVDGLVQMFDDVEPVAVPQVVPEEILPFSVAQQREIARLIALGKTVTIGPDGAATTASNPVLGRFMQPETRMMCQAPPWGYVAGADLRTGTIAYKRRNGTIYDMTPLPLPLKVGLPGMYLVVQPSGAKSWAVRYRHGGRPRKLTLGPCPALDLKTVVAGVDQGWHSYAPSDIAQGAAADDGDRHEPVCVFRPAGWTYWCDGRD